MKDLRPFRRLVAPLQRRIMLAIGRAVVRLVDDAQATQELQITLLSGEVRDGVERLAEYGFTSVPLPGAQALALFVGGNRDHGVVVATGDRRYRPTGLEPGESAQHDHQGQLIHIKANGEIIIHAAASVRVQGPTSVRIEAPTSTITGNLVVEGTIQAAGVIQSQAAILAAGDVFALAGTPSAVAVGALRDTYNVHFHPENDNAPAPTNPPSTLLP